ncbi:MAG TPA: group II truncated hemoglobin [Anaerolineales bacterium]|jgi:hemoglobin|nr:group II truncated hemoglobin [Anaerolineales bacterium]
MITPTVYEWAGGQGAFEKLTAVFYAKVLNDDLLGDLFGAMSEDHSKYVARFLSEVLGGPKLYTGESKRSHAHMISRHVGRKLDETQRKRWVQLFLESADEVGMPDDPEFRSALVGYLEWGSRMAVKNSQADENPIDENTPMPKWGWGEPGEPYRPRSKDSE